MAPSQIVRRPGFLDLFLTKQRVVNNLFVRVGKGQWEPGKVH